MEAEPALRTPTGFSNPIHPDHLINPIPPVTDAAEAADAATEDRQAFSL